jgi:hypothetical protein
MLRVFSFLFLSILFLSCTSEKNNHAIDNQLNLEQQDLIKNNLIRYIGRLPNKGSHQTKFDTSFNNYYTKLAEEHELKLYQRETKTGRSYFFITRLAPSLHEKYVGIGGWYKLDESGKIAEIEEVFRTWKMPMDELIKKAEFLFPLMLKQEDLSPYYTTNSDKDFIIEFPDKETYYDKDQRRWISKREDFELYYDRKEKANAARLPDTVNQVP